MPINTSWVRVQVAQFNAMVDTELIIPFQKFVYYPIIIGMTTYLAFGASTPPQAIEENLAGIYYWAWLVLGLVFPPMSLMGRHLYRQAPNRGAGNGAYGGALLMLFGDFGTWSAVLVYILCTVNTFWWGQGLWAVGFVMMGALGGAIFTYRSARRLLQIKHREVS